MGKFFIYSMVILLVMTILGVYLGYYKVAYISSIIFGTFAMGLVGIKASPPRK